MTGDRSGGVGTAQFTVLGASGFIGSHVTADLRAQGARLWLPARGESLRDRPLGHVLYCVGLTADFRERPFDTVEAHVGLLKDVLQHSDFESLLYLSSTRVYAGADSTDETACLRVDPCHADQLYNISKLMGESLCLACGRPNVRVARLSNVYGGDDRSSNFLSAVIRDAVERGDVELHTGLESEKDYVNVRDVVRLLPTLARFARHRVYNVASGENTSHAALLDVIRDVTRCAVRVAPGAPLVRFAPISTTRVREEFAWAPSSVLDDLRAFVRRRCQRIPT